MYKHKATEGPGDSDWACARGEFMDSYKAASPYPIPLLATGCADLAHN